jgi:hypothetical protein
MRKESDVHQRPELRDVQNWETPRPGKVTMNAEEPCTLTSGCWTAKRLELKAWMAREAPSLSELYEGAVCLLFEKRLPGYTRFVAHAVREIRNRLPDMLSASQPVKQLHYKNRLDAISTAGKRPDWEQTVRFRSLRQRRIQLDRGRRRFLFRKI